MLDDVGGEPADSLHTAECTLRREGKHVLLDEENRGIWVFSLSRAEKEELPQFLSPLGLGCSSSGIVQAADLTEIPSQVGSMQKHTNVPRLVPPLPKGPAETNAHAFNLNTKSPSQMPEHGFGVPQNDGANSRQGLKRTDLYPRVVAAITQSLVHSLAAHEEFLRIGPYTCIESRTLGERLVEDLTLRWVLEKTSTITLEVKWLSSGTLIISYSRGHLPRLCRASSILSDGKRRGLSHGLPLLLSPSGAIVKFHEIEETPMAHPSYRSLRNLKRSISFGLAHTGILVPQDSSWLRVLVENSSPCPDRERLINGHDNLSITLWPAYLCLCRDSIALQGDLPIGISSHFTQDGSMEALASAESWLLGKAARLEALETQRRKGELDAPRTKENRDADDDDGDLSDIGIQTSQYITQQDVSGIYPTPPDGVPANNFESPPTNKTHTTGIENVDDASSTPGALSQQYEEHGNEYLYREMDIDMFASNGLTEADFSFFDEPSMNDGKSLQEEPNHTIVDNLEGNVVTEPVPMTIPSDGNAAQEAYAIQDGRAEPPMSAEDRTMLGAQGMAACPNMFPLLS